MGAAALTCFSVSCTKDTPHVAPPVDESTSAKVQAFSATVKATRNYIYVDGVPVTGAALAYGGVFPGTAYSFRVNGGTRAFWIKDTALSTTQAPLTFNETMDAGSSYTIFTYDTITSPKEKTVLNNIVVPKDTTCMVRFANFVYNKTAVANVDVYSYRRISGTPTMISTPFLGGANVTAPSFASSTPVFKNVATTGVTDFIPYASGLTDTLYVFATGTTSPLLLKGFVTSLTPTRSYTAAYTGSYLGAGTRAFSLFATY